MPGAFGWPGFIGTNIKFTAMKKINITTKGEILEYPSLTILKAYADQELPKAKNVGWNHYLFTEPVEFNIDVPLNLHYETAKYKWYRREFEVYSPSGKCIHLHTERVFNNEAGEIERESTIIS